MDLDPQLLVELGRCYAAAALNELLRAEAPAPTTMKTTNKDEKEQKDIIAVRDVRAELQR